MKRLGSLLLIFFIGLNLAGRTAAPSFDGRIAFLRLSNGYWQIWLMEADGKSPHQLTTSPMDKHSLSWCPGNEVIHYYNDVGAAMLVELRTGREQAQAPLLAPIPPPRGPDGEPLELPGDLRRILREGGSAAPAGLTCGDPDEPIGETIELNASSILPEGMAVAVQRRPVANPDRLFELKLVDTADPTDYGRFRSDGKPATTEKVLSPSGQVSFLVPREGRDEVWIRSGSGSPEPIAALDGRTGHLSWSPDGQWLLFDSDFEGASQIYRLASARKETIERLTDGRSPSKHPVYSPPPGYTP